MTVSRPHWDFPAECYPGDTFEVTASDTGKVVWIEVLQRTCFDTEEEFRDYVRSGGDSRTKITVKDRVQ